MEKLFYIIVTLFFVYELLVLVCRKRIFEAMKNCRNRIKEAKQEGKPTDVEAIGGTMVAFQIFNIFYLIFTVIGFMSSQWLPFVCLFILGLIPKRWLFIAYIDSIVSLSILAFILINKFHLHIQFFSM